MRLSTKLNQQRTKVAADLRQLAPNIGKDTEELLFDMYTAQELRGTASDNPIRLDVLVRISIAQGAQLNRIIRESGATKSLEIGFAYGYSTIWILDALRLGTNARHVAIDPFELTLWGGVGLQQVKRFGVAIDWIAEPSIHALSRLIKDEARFDFIFIDGNHRFDDVLVDFHLSDQLVRAGGILAFDDMWMPSVRSVASFVLRNCHYKIFPQPVRNMLVLMKIADDDRDWRHFERFRVAYLETARLDLTLKQLIKKAARMSGTEKMLRRIHSRFSAEPTDET
jgi:predicted O-methyltransferase YrrM